jgi:hypothetical protein
MRAVSVLWVAGALVLVAAGFGRSSAGTLSQLRVCGQRWFAAYRYRCVKDEGARPLRSSHFYCSAHQRGHRGDRFSGHFSYEGRPFPARGARVPVSSGDVFIDLTVGNTPLPGGRWGCEIRVGSDRVSRRFRSGGSRGTVLGVGACLTAHTTRAGPVRVCRSDESARPLPPTRAATCSAVFPLAEGKIARVELLYEAKPTGIALAKRIPFPVAAFGVQLKAKTKRLTAGPYDCGFSLDRARVATRHFSISR